MTTTLSLPASSTSTKSGSKKSDKASKSSPKSNIHYLHPYLLRDHPIHVTVIGVGGTGCMVLKEFARMHYALIGVGHQGLHVTAYDADTVSESNIGRQLFLHEDIGQNKAVCMINRINLAWGIHWNAVDQNYEDDMALNSIVISCTDTIKSRKYLVGKLMEKERISLRGLNEETPLYWFDCGNGNDYGQVRLFTFSAPEKSPKSKKYKVVSSIPYIDIYANKEDRPDEPSCSLAQALGKQDLMVNSMIAQIALQMLWSLIYKKFIDYKGVYVNLATMSMRALPL